MRLWSDRLWAEWEVPGDEDKLAYIRPQGLPKCPDDNHRDTPLCGDP